MPSILCKGEVQDQISTDLNSCSLEVLYDGFRGVYPIIIGCYQLDDDSSARNGELRLYAVPMDTSYATFGHVVQTVNPKSGGVLDGKFLQNSSENQRPLFATANASGSISIYGLSADTIEHNLTLQSLNCSKDPESTCLALSLAWDEFSSSQILSSYSNGEIAIHSLHRSSDEKYEIEESMRWKAHELFRCPTEVWSCCYANNRFQNLHAYTVISGGDDCKMRLWDVRNTSNATHTMTAFDAGVTALSYHPTLEHIFAVGSYDESLRIMDMRKLEKPIANINVGGGVWRAKWHPEDKNRILVGAMHGGCRIVQADCVYEDFCTDADGIKINVEFTNHKSMAYGADWLRLPSRKEGPREYAASCSFYDKQGYMWITEHES